MQNLAQLDTGYRRDQLLLVTVNPEMGGLRDAAIPDFYEQTLKRLETVPAVLSASLQRNTPLGGGWNNRLDRFPDTSLRPMMTD